MSWLINLLRDPSVKNIDVDGEDRINAHRSLLARKAMLRKVFTDIHILFDRLDKSHLRGTGTRVELGAGIAPMRDSYPDVLATDIVPSPQLDKVVNAENMDLPDGSVRVLFGQNCFHHFPNPKRFFAEAERVLVPGGGIILLEPYYGPIASALYPRLFPTEGFDKQYPSWETPATGPMNGANQALSYIVFKRDRREFEQLFPNLHITHHEICNSYLLYLLSGGLNFRQLCPNWAIPVLSLAQKLISPFSRWLALHHIIVIQKAD